MVYGWYGDGFGMVLRPEFHWSSTGAIIYLRTDSHDGCDGQLRICSKNRHINLTSYPIRLSMQKAVTIVITVIAQVIRLSVLSDYGCMLIGRKACEASFQIPEFVAKFILRLNRGCVR